MLRSFVFFGVLFLLVRYVYDRLSLHAHMMQQDFLKHTAHLLKLQDVRNSCQIYRLIDQLCRIWLPKLRKDGVI